MYTKTFGGTDNGFIGRSHTYNGPGRKIKFNNKDVVLRLGREVVGLRWRLEFEFEHLTHLFMCSDDLHRKMSGEDKQYFEWNYGGNKDVFNRPIIYRFLKDEYFNELIDYKVNKKDFYSPFGDLDESFCVRKYNDGILLSGFILKGFEEKGKINSQYLEDFIKDLKKDNKITPSVLKVLTDDKINLLISEKEFEQVQNMLIGFKKEKEKMCND